MKGYRDDRIRELEALYPFWQEKPYGDFLRRQQSVSRIRTLL